MVTSGSGVHGDMRDKNDEGARVKSTLRMEVGGGERGNAERLPRNPGRNQPRCLGATQG